MVIAVERSHQRPDRGSSVGLYKPIKGHLMAGRQSGQGTLFLPAVMGVPSLSKELYSCQPGRDCCPEVPKAAVGSHPTQDLGFYTSPHPLLPGKQHLCSVMGVLMFIIHRSPLGRSPPPCRAGVQTQTS